MKNWTAKGTLESRQEDGAKGGTMRLGSYECKISEGTLAFDVYGKSRITERHRHRYEVNYDKYKDSLKYQPKLYKTYYRGLTDSAFTDMSFNIDDNITLHDNILYNVPFPEFEQGFTFDTKRNGEKKGWLVFVGSKSDVAENDTISLQLTIYRTELEFQEDTFQYEIKKPAVIQTILGGFYINPVFDGVGKIRFDLSGVVRKIKDKWYVVSAVSYQSDNNTIILTPATPVQTDEAEVEDKEDKKGKNNKN